LAALVEAVRELGPNAIILDYDFSIHRDAADTAAFDRLLSSWTSKDPLLLLPAELMLASDGQATRTVSVLEPFPEDAHVFWISVLFRKDSSRRVREWRLWEYSCEPHEVFLSPQLIVSALNRGGVAEIDRVHQALAGVTTCGGSPKDPGRAIPQWLGDGNPISPINYVFGRDSQPYRDAMGYPLLTEWSAINV